MEDRGPGDKDFNGLGGTMLLNGQRVSVVTIKS